MPDFNRTITLIAAVQTVMGQIGLTQPATVIGSADRTVASFLQLTNQAGKWLASKYEWQVLQREHVITTDGSLSYALPDDWDGYVGDTAWNSTSQLPMGGPVPLPAWQMLKIRSLGSTTINLMYRIQNGNIIFQAVPTAPQTLKIWYNSRRWVVATNGTTYRDECQANDDVIRYEPYMFLAVVKWKWREARGFSTAAAKAEAMDAIFSTLGRDQPPVTLSIVPVNSFPFLGVQNIPDTGYGS